VTDSIDIVIVNWNSGDQLRDCLTSIDFGSAAVVVVDNNSTDGSIAAAATLSSPAQFMMAGENHGFAKACNIGARQGSSEYLLFLNPDTRLEPETISACISFLESGEGATVGVLGPQLVDELGRVQKGCARSPTWWTYFGKGIGLDLISPRLSPPVQLVEFSHLETRDVDHVIGAAYFIRRRIFEDIGGFDERFFVYLEDLDLSLRVRQAGWRVVYFAGARAYHKGGGTSEQVKARRLFYSLSSRVRYARKHFSRTGALLVILSACGPEFVSRVVRAVLHRSGQELRDTIQAYGMLYSSLPELLGNPRPRPALTN
jgi:GT2 family glycosyltransferase